MVNSLHSHENREQIIASQQTGAYTFNPFSIAATLRGEIAKLPAGSDIAARMTARLAEAEEQARILQNITVEAHEIYWGMR